LHIFASIECIIDFLQHVLHSTLGLLKLLKIFSPREILAQVEQCNGTGLGQQLHQVLQLR
jgi:hypothetical protein